MNFKSIFFGSLSIAAVGFAASPLLALSTNGDMTSQSNLEKHGYVCEPIATGFKECAKGGSQTYWCNDAGECQLAPNRKAPIRKLPGNVWQLPTVEQVSTGK